MDFDIKKEGKFKYVEEGEGPPLLLLHGLFGALSNFTSLIKRFNNVHKVVVPLLPIFELPLRAATLPSLLAYVQDFVRHKKYESVIVLGNSLGGHIALLYALNNLSKVKAMILTGSSGLFENAFGDTFPKRKNYDFIKQKTEFTFYNPATATKALVDEVFDIVNNREKAIRVITVAKSAIRHNMAENLPTITVPTLLIWGLHDRITPPFVAEEFQQKLPNAQLFFMEECGHAPMMEQPEQFNILLDRFLKRNDLSTGIKLMDS